MERERVAVIGAGILGLAHAWVAAELGHDVTVFERDSQARSASIRNFGMIWPIGQPAGEWHELALRSRERWVELGRRAGIWVHARGSIHLAHRADEWTVLQEFESLSKVLGYECDLLSPADIMKRTPAANPDRLLGGLFSSTELCVNPRIALPRLATWLRESFDVRVAFSTSVVEVTPAPVAGGMSVKTFCDGNKTFDRVIVCGGVDCYSLFPATIAASNLRLCKLQMLKTAPQAQAWRMGPHLASGLTLRHYRNFEVCAGLVVLRQRISGESPELDQFGIHVMASQNDEGEVILGDSHEYGKDVSPFDKVEIDELILSELGKVICVPNWSIAERWHGYYVKCGDGSPIFQAEPLPRVHLCTGAGGAGMTLSFGIADENWRRWTH